MIRTNLVTLLTVVVIGLFWGLNWPAIKFLLTEVPPFTIRLGAFSVATTALLAYALATGERLVPPWRELPWMALTGLLTIFSFNMLTTLGQILTETSKAAIIAYTMPALTALFSALFLGERLRPAVMLALAVGMGGIAVLAAENLADLVANPLGPLIMLGAATVWALGTVALKAGRFTLAPMGLTVWFMGLSALTCAPFAFALEDPLGQSQPSTGAVAVWLWHAMLPMVVNYALWTRLVGTVPASVAAIATLLAPVVGVASAMILLGDPTTWQKITALAMILGSIALTFLRPSRRRKDGVNPLPRT